MGGGWGIEDIIFCFHVGAMSWLCAVWPLGVKIKIGSIGAAAIKRLVMVCIAATAVLVSLLAAHVPIMFAFVATQAIIAAGLLLNRPSYARIAGFGAIVFTAYYFVLLSMWRLLMPNFMLMWDGSQIINATLMGVPFEEYLWVASIGIGFPLTIAFSLDARVATDSVT